VIRLALIFLLASAIAGGTAGGLAGRLIHRGGQAVVSATDHAGCKRPSGVVSISFSKTKFPHVRAHELSAVARGYPRVLVLERDGASQRREHLLANVDYVPSTENRAHGSTMGAKLRRYCSGTRFRYVWY
jgi:hypothetical protein